MGATVMGVAAEGGGADGPSCVFADSEAVRRGAAAFANSGTAPLTRTFEQRDDGKTEALIEDGTNEAANAARCGRAVLQVEAAPPPTPVRSEETVLDGTGPPITLVVTPGTTTV